jgi:hypothetical protein
MVVYSLPTTEPGRFGQYADGESFLWGNLSTLCVCLLSAMIYVPAHGNNLAVYGTLNPKLRLFWDLNMSSCFTT